ncbi:hypothetical protein O0L34_g4264 [Tuta absoluta]|nr:hypothetical protein O0L34_g4264 [Tuta absoluta]
MLLNGGRKATILVIYLLILCFQIHARKEETKDQTTCRANTLFDDADDIQRQLDNEVRDKYGQLKTVWVFHVPSRNGLHSIKPTTPPYDINVRLKRKMDKARFKSFYQGLDKPEQGPHNKRSDEECDCKRKCKCRKKMKPKEKCKKCKEKSKEEYKNFREEYMYCECKECKEKEKPEGETKEKEELEKENMETEKAVEECDDNCEKEKPKEEGPEAVPQTSEPTWSFSDQHRWHEKYKACGGNAQSPVNLPVKGLIQVKGARKLVFANYDVAPCNLTVVNDGIRVMMYGNWPKDKWPLVYGGAAHSRRYLFHSLSVYWPSEHPVGGMYYPMETQLLHISSEYSSFDEAVKASSKDPLAFMGVVNIYTYAETSHPGVMQILNAAQKCSNCRISIPPISLDKFSAPFSGHVCYYGSLTFPPCSQSVLWIIRRRSLPLTREATQLLHNILRTPGQEHSYSPHVGEVRQLTIRTPQPLNDRKVFLILENKKYT